MVTDFCRRYSIGDPAKSSFGRIDGEEKEVVREKRLQRLAGVMSQRQLESRDTFRHPF